MEHQQVTQRIATLAALSLFSGGIAARTPFESTSLPQLAAARQQDGPQDRPTKSADISPLYFKMPDNTLLRIRQVHSQLIFEKSVSGYAQVGGEIVLLGAAVGASVTAEPIYFPLTRLEALAFFDGNWDTAYNLALDQGRREKWSVDPNIVALTLGSVASHGAAFNPSVFSEKLPTNDLEGNAQVVTRVPLTLVERLMEAERTGSEFGPFTKEVRVIPERSPVLDRLRKGEFDDPKVNGVVPVVIRMSDCSLLRVCQDGKEIYFERTQPGYGSLEVTGIIFRSIAPRANVYQKIDRLAALALFDNDPLVIYAAVKTQSLILNQSVDPVLVARSLKISERDVAAVQVPRLPQHKVE